MLCYGGSFTHGYVVPSDQAYPARLEALLNASGASPGIKVVNKARYGLWGVKHVRRAIRSDVAAFRPRVVVLEPTIQDFDIPESRGFRKALEALSELRLYRLGRLLAVPELTGDPVLELDGVRPRAENAPLYEAPDPLVYTALVCSSLGKEHLVEGLLRRSLARRPNAEALHLLGEMALHQGGDRGELDRIVRSLKELADGPDGGPGPSYLLGGLLYGMKRYAEAETYLKIAPPSLLLADTYRAMEKQAEEEETLLSVLRQGGPWKAVRRLSKLYAKQGRTEKAVEVLRDEMARQDRMALRVELEALYRNMGREDLAKEVAPDWKTLKSHMEEIAGVLREAGASAVFLVMAPAETFASSAILETAQRTGAAFVDVRQAYEDQPEGRRKVLRQEGDIHWSAAGNRWVAGLVAPAVRDELIR